MVATELTLTQYANSYSKNKHAWGGTGTYDTTGDETYDEICYFRVTGAERISIACIDNATQAGSLRIYGQVADTTPTAATVLTSGTFDQIGSDTAVSADEIVNTHITNLYHWIAITFAKTAAGAETGHITINVLIQ